MTKECFKIIIKTIEERFGKQFGSQGTRSKILNLASRDMKGCSDAAAMKAADDIIMQFNTLPTPDTLVKYAKRYAIADAKIEDNEQERRARVYGKSQTKQPMDKKIRDMMTIFSKGVSRKNWIGILRGIAQEYPGSGVDPNQYIEMLGRQEKIRKIDMDAYVGTGAAGLIDS